MKRQFLRKAALAGLILLAALVGPGAGAAASDATVKRELGEWFEVQTPTFVLVANTDEAPATEMAARLESFRAVLEREIPDLNPPPKPVTIHALDSRKALRHFYPQAPRGIGGVYLRGGGTDVILIDAGTSLRQQHVYHEYVHYRLRSSFFGLPAWLNEGLAYYFQTFQRDADGASVGSNVPGLGRGGKSIPLRELLSTTVEAKRYATRGFARRSWEVVRYVMSREDSQSALQRLLAATPGTHADVLTRIAGQPLDQLEAAVKRGTSGKAEPHRLESIEKAFDEGASASTGTSLLEDAEVRIHQGELLEAVGGTPQDIQDNFVQALAEAPDNVRALLGTARVLTAGGDLENAEKRVARALQRDHKSAAAYLQRGHIAMRRFAIWRDTREATASQTLHHTLIQARGAFLQASVLDPKNLAAVRSYARTFLFDPTTRQPGIEACLAALSIRDDLDLALTLVELYSDDANQEAAHATRVERILPAHGALSLHTTAAWAKVASRLADYDRLLAERLFEAGQREQALSVLRDASTWAVGDSKTRVTVLLKNMSERAAN